MQNVKSDSIISSQKKWRNVSCVEAVWIPDKWRGADEAGLQNMLAAGTKQVEKHQEPP